MKYKAILICLLVFLIFILTDNKLVGYAKAWCALGMTKNYMGNYNEARAALQKAIDLDPIGEGGQMAAKNLEILENNLK